MKYLWIVFFAMLLAACSVIQVQDQEAVESANEEPDSMVVQEQKPTDIPLPTPSVDLPDLGEAPEMVNEVWLNTDKPLRLADLRGSVVLLDMWTFG